MKKSEFEIGIEFYIGKQKWKCTDIGTRIIVAIKLGPRKIIHHSNLPDGTFVQQSEMTDDPSWLKGPPYAVEECVFDENDIPGCSLKSD